MRVQAIAICVAGLCAMAQPAGAETGWTTSKVNMRTGPSTGHPVIVLLPKNAELEIQSCANGWCKARYASRTGYVSEKYVETESDFWADCYIFYDC